MPKDLFKFKCFTIKQDQCAMKVGTDGVLLGCWASIRAHARVLDIGTGTGLIALMAAQRGANYIDAVEIEPKAAQQAQENIEESPWKNKINVHNCDIGNFESTHKYDHILSNPPFYESPLLPPDKARSIARNTLALSPELLAHSVARLLAEKGTFSVILPADSYEKLNTALAGEGLYLNRKTLVNTNKVKPSRRILLEFSRKIMPTTETILTLNDKNGQRTDEYHALTSDFYLDI